MVSEHKSMSVNMHVGLNTVSANITSVNLDLTRFVLKTHVTVTIGMN